MKLKQLLCPLKPTWYLVGGAEFGHLWRGVVSIHSTYIICKKCGLKEYLVTYGKDSEEARWLKDKFQTPKL